MSRKGSAKRTKGVRQQNQEMHMDTGQGRDADGGGRMLG